MAVEKNFSVAIVDIEKIEDVNKILFKYATHVKEYSAYYYFNLEPMDIGNIKNEIQI